MSEEANGTAVEVDDDQGWNDDEGDPSLSNYCPQWLAKRAPWILFVGALAGLAASFALAVETYFSVKNPDYNPLCSANIFVTCSASMASEFGSMIGDIPNAFFGVAGFAALAGLAAVPAFKGSLPRWMWGPIVAGLVGGILVVHWLVYVSAVRLATLCPYCMVIWVFTIPAFVYTVLYAGSSGWLSRSPRLARKFASLSDFHLPIVIGWFVLLVAFIVFNMWDGFAVYFGL